MRQLPPRWAFMVRLKVPCRFGLVLLVRLVIVQTPWFGVYSHDINSPDSDPDPHNHPWTFFSLVLRGSYTEILHPIPWVMVDSAREQTWKRWSVHRMNRETAHRIVEVSPGLKTLVLSGRRRGDWGFFTDSGWVLGSDYLAGREGRAAA